MGFGLGEKHLKGIDRFTIKWVAMISMFIDHVGSGLVHKDTVAGQAVGICFNTIGRMAFPLFVYLLVDGFTRTKSKPKFFLRLLLFAVISEVPFDLMSSGRILNIGYQNVMWTLLFGFAFMWATQLVLEDKFFDGVRGIALVIPVLVGALFLLCGYAFRTDYSLYGVLCVIVQYIFVFISKKKPVIAHIRTDVLGLFFVILILTVMNHSEIFAAPALLLVMNYYRKADKKMPKWIGYAFYPAHMLMIGLLSIGLYRWTGGLIGKAFHVM